MENFHCQEPETIAKEFSSNLASGLSEKVIETNRSKYGWNKLNTKKEKHWIIVFLEQYKDILMILLLASSIISLIVQVFPTKESGWGEELLKIEAWENFLLIVGVTIVNATIGTVQVIKSRKSLNSLKSLSQPKTKVLRDNKSQTIDTSDVVVGDIILLEAGDLIPADARLIEAASLKVNESSLTGESETILKNTILMKDKAAAIGDRLNCVYSGCLVTYGRAKAIVTGVGQSTELGKINTLLNSTVEQKTPLQNNLDKLAKILMWAVLGICLILLGVNLAKISLAESLTPEHVLPIFSDSLNFSIALAVAVIPEALSSIVTIVLSISTKKMAKHNAIVKNLKSVEGLGSVSVICSDKTGTLTQNKMTVTNFFTNLKLFNENEFDKKDLSHNRLVNYISLCSDAKVNGNKAVGDPTEICLIDYLIKKISSQETLVKNNKRISELPFDSERMMMSVLIKDNKSNIMITKGAIDNVLERVTQIDINGKVRKVTKSDIDAILAANKQLSSEGKRVLCCCYKEIKNSTITFKDENNFTFIGLVSMIDPPRPEVIQAVKECQQSGIRVVMITGDHEGTAVAIGKQIGIFRENDWSMSGRELTKISQDKLACDVAKYSVYARVSPEDKIKIVNAWQSHNMIVSMTGDGVNDAPALKQADIGVAMGITGTEVSKDAASIILTDDNFATIVAAVKFGRSVYNNLKSAIKFLLTGNLATIFICTVLTILSLSLKIIISPFTALQLLFLNLLTDSWPAISLGLEKYRNNVIHEKPRKANEFFLNKRFCLNILFEALIMTIIVLAVFALAFHTCVGTNEVRFEVASGLAFITLSFCRFFHGWNCKSDKPAIFTKEFYDNWFLVGSLCLGLGLMSIIYYVEPVNHVFLESSINHAVIARADVFVNYGIWVAFGFGFLIIPLIQLYKWGAYHLNKKCYGA